MAKITILKDNFNFQTDNPTERFILPLKHIHQIERNRFIISTAKQKTNWLGSNSKSDIRSFILHQ